MVTIRNPIDNVDPNTGFATTTNGIALDRSYLNENKSRRRQEMKTESPTYLKCPRCCNDKFTEFATEETSQTGVRLTSTGDRDYEKAGACNPDGDYIEVTGYACQGCGAKYKFSEGILTKETP